MKEIKKKKNISILTSIENSVVTWNKHAFDQLLIGFLG